MRNFQMKRQRGRNRNGNPSSGGGKPVQNANRAFDSTGPENIKVRGHAQHVYEKYQSLARDAASAGDRVLAENYLQHAEHYFRTIRALQPGKPVTEIVGRETFASGFDIDFEDEGVAAAIEATDAAALEREQNGGGAPLAEAGEAEAPQGQGGGQNGQGGQGGGQNQNRPWEPRPPRNDRYENRDRADRYPNDRPREDRFANDRPREDRPQTNDRPREDRQQNADRPREDRQQNVERPREDRPREDRQGGGDRPRYENRDRPFNRERDRDQGGERPRYERQDRPDRGDRTDRPDRAERPERGERSEPAAEIASPLVAPTLESTPEPATPRMLRSEDGGMSHAPAFLQGAAPAAAVGEGEEPSKPARRRRKPKAEGAPEPSEG